LRGQTCPHIQNFLSCSKYTEDNQRSGLHQQYGL